MRRQDDMWALICLWTSTWSWPPPCGCHKWMAPKIVRYCRWNQDATKELNLWQWNWVTGRVFFLRHRPDEETKVWGSDEQPEANLAVGQRGQLTPWSDLVNKVAYFRTKCNF